MTPTGRIKKNVSGRCNATLPPPFRILAAEIAITYKRGIWPDFEGACDLFEVRK
ncbi:hypothetical protein ABIC89_001026 [Variovorax boronicumulans]|uniref:hypothetical protein n=1 Tax=Variovorax boronicumulans TaxID=436515 RepID=UPI0033910C73